MRRQDSRRSKLFLCWPHDEQETKAMLVALSQTVADCPDLKRPGYFHPSNTIVFFANTNTTEESRNIVNVVFEERYVQRHPQAFAFYPSERASNFVMARFNIYESRQSRALVNPQGDGNGFGRLLEDFPMQVCIKTKYILFANITGDKCFYRISLSKWAACPLPPS